MEVTRRDSVLRDGVMEGWKGRSLVLAGERVFERGSPGRKAPLFIDIFAGGIGNVIRLSHEGI